MTTFSKYFPGTIEEYNDPVAVELWEARTAFMRDHCGKDYVLAPNLKDYLPRLPIERIPPAERNRKPDPAQV
jgi:hypothetical protein